MTNALSYTFIPIIPETKVPALGAGWHYDQFEYGSDWRGDDRRQAGHATTEKARLAVIDVDDSEAYADGHLPPAFAETKLGTLLLQVNPAFPVFTYVSASSHTKMHVYLDLREWEGPWPTQWATKHWPYDVKSNGFVRAEPAYLPVSPVPALPVSLLGKVFEAIAEDQEHAAYLAASHNGTAQGLATGASARWTPDMPDASVTGDNELTSAVMSMVARGLEDEEIFGEVDRVKCPLEDDWSEDDIQSKIDRARDKMDRDPRVVRRFLDAFVSPVRREAIEREAWAEAERRSYYTAMGIPLPFSAQAPDYGDHNYPALLGPPLLTQEQQPQEGDWSPVGFTDQQVALSCLDEILRRGRHRFVRELSRLIERRADHWEVLTDKDGAASALLSYLAWSLPDSVIPYDKDEAKKLKEESAGWGDDEDLETVAEARAKLAEYKKFEQKMRFQNSATCSGIVTKMRSLMDSHPVTISALDLDNNPDVLWAGGTAWDLATSQPSPRVHALTPHLLTAGYTPDFSGRPTPLFDAWMKAVLPDEAIKDWVLNLMGATLAGGGKFIPELISYKGNTGKTSTVELLADLLGSYAEVLPEDLLTGQQSHPEVYLRLKGKKICYFDEQPGKGRASTNKIKALAGGSRLSGRGVNGREVVSFKPSHTLWLTVNEDIPLGDEAVQLRIRRVYFNGSIDKVSAAAKGIWHTSRSMTDPWKAEAPAVLGMLMLRCRNYIGNPNLTVPPPHAEMELIEAVAEQDTVYEWFTSSVQDKPGMRVTNDLLRGAYTDWCKRVGIPEGRRVQDTREFGRLVSKAAGRCGIQGKQYKSGSTRGWEGMGLNPLVQAL